MPLGMLGCGVLGGAEIDGAGCQAGCEPLAVPLEEEKGTSGAAKVSRGADDPCGTITTTPESSCCCRGTWAGAVAAGAR